MPNALIEKVARVGKLSKEQTEHLWGKAKKIAEDNGFKLGKSSEDDSRFYAYTVGIFKHMITKKTTEKLKWNFPERWTQKASASLLDTIDVNTATTSTNNMFDNYDALYSESSLVDPMKTIVNPLKMFSNSSFSLGQTHEVIHVSDTDLAKTQQIKLADVGDHTGNSVETPIDASFWLPLAAPYYGISKNLNDYVLMTVPAMISSIPNTNGDSVDLSELLDFSTTAGMPAYRTFRGKPCIASGALVATDLGLIPIEDIRARKAKTVLTKDGTAEIKEWAKTGYHKTVNVLTKAGKFLKTTADHPFMVMTKDCILKWVNAGDLKQDDKVIVRLGGNKILSNQTLLFKTALNAINELYASTSTVTNEKTGKSYNSLVYKPSRTTVTSVPGKMTDKLARLLGYLISEGCVTHSIDFHNTDQELIDDYVECFKSCFGKTPRIITRKRQDGVMYEANENRYRVIKRSKTGYVATFSSDGVKLWLEKIGLSIATACDKTVPACVLQAKRRHILEFFRAYIEGDGCLSGFMVGMYTVSFELAQQLKTLIESLGYTATVSEYNKTQKQSNHKTLWSVQLAQSEGLAFMREVGVVTSNKQKAMEKIEKRRADQPEKDGWVTHSRRIPHVRDWSKKVASIHRTGTGASAVYHDHKGKKLNISVAVTGYDRGKLTKPSTVKTLSSILKPLNPSYKSRLDQLLGDFVFDSIESVTHNTVAEPVYDIQTTAEQFTANGVVVHNCYLEHNSSDMKQAKGVILDVFLRPLKGFANNKHAKLIQLLAFDKTKDPELCKKIDSGEANTVSIGIYYQSYSCSLCGNTVSPSAGKPCTHTYLKCRTYQDRDTGRLVYRHCHKMFAFETSVVADPAYVSAIGSILRP